MDPSGLIIIIIRCEGVAVRRTFQCFYSVNKVQLISDSSTCGAAFFLSFPQMAVGAYMHVRYRYNFFLELDFSAEVAEEEVEVVLVTVVLGLSSSVDFIKSFANRVTALPNTIAAPATPR